MRAGAAPTMAPKPEPYLKNDQSVAARRRVIDGGRRRRARRWRAAALAAASARLVSLARRAAAAAAALEHGPLNKGVLAGGGGGEALVWHVLEQLQDQVVKVGELRTSKAHTEGSVRGGRRAGCGRA